MRLTPIARERHHYADAREYEGPMGESKDEILSGKELCELRLEYAEDAVLLQRPAASAIARRRFCVIHLHRLHYSKTCGIRRCVSSCSQRVISLPQPNPSPGPRSLPPALVPT
jgi:hypothetical protein